MLRLRVLHMIWIANPALLAYDFGACLDYFSDENLAQIQKVVATSGIPERSHFVEAAPDLSAEINRLLGLLRDEPKPCRELVAAMGLKRGLLLKKALIPAEAQGLIEKTERGSSPRQKYRLTEAGVAAMAEQVRLEGVTGRSDPVTAELKKREKQDLLPRKGFMPVGMIFFHAGGCAPVRLARYRRGEECTACNGRVPPCPARNSPRFSRMPCSMVSHDNISRDSRNRTSSCRSAAVEPAPLYGQPV